MAEEPLRGSYAIKYVCMYVCMHVCVYVCMYVCVYACMHVWVYVCVYVCMYVWMNEWMNECMYVCKYSILNFSDPWKDVRGRNEWLWHLINTIRGKDIPSDYGSSGVSSRYLCHKNKYLMTRAEPISIVPVSVCYVRCLWQSKFRIVLRFVFNLKRK